MRSLKNEPEIIYHYTGIEAKVIESGIPYREK